MRACLSLSSQTRARSLLTIAGCGCVTSPRPHWSSGREPLLARAPLRTGRASWPRIRLKHGISPSFKEPAPVDRCRKVSAGDTEDDVDRQSTAKAAAARGIRELPEGSPEPERLGDRPLSSD